MAVVVADVALDLRLITAASDDVDPGHSAILTRHLAAASSIVESRAASAPDALKDAATIAIAAYLFDKPSAPASARYSSAWANSGASSLLAPYVGLTAVPIGAAAGEGDTGTSPAPSGPAVDQVARDAADEALAAARAAANPDPATNDQADDPNDEGLRSWSSLLIARVVRAVVPSWARARNPPTGTGLPALPEDGREYTLLGRDNIGAGGQNDPIRYWSRPNYVPDTPGTAGGIGHVLTATGEGDKDYAFRALNVATAVAAYLRDNPVSARDTTARNEAAAASNVANRAARSAATNAAAIASIGARRSDAEIIALIADSSVNLSLNPPSIPPGAAAKRVYHATLQTVPNAFPTANVAEVWFAGSRRVALAYAPATRAHVLQFEVDETLGDNLQTNGRLDEGDSIEVEVRLKAPGGTTVASIIEFFPVYPVAAAAAAPSLIEIASVELPASGAASSAATSYDLAGKGDELLAAGLVYVGFQSETDSGQEVNQPISICIPSPDQGDGGFAISRGGINLADHEPWLFGGDIQAIAGGKGVLRIKRTTGSWFGGRIKVWRLG